MTRLVKPTAPPKRIPGKFTEEDLRADVPDTGMRTTDVDGHLDNEPIEDEDEREEERVLEELPEQTGTRESPAQTRREPEIPESPIKEPPEPAIGQAQAESQARKTAATEVEKAAAKKQLVEAGEKAVVKAGTKEAAVATAPEWVPIVLIVFVVIAAIAVVIALVFALRTGNRGQGGSTQSQPVDTADKRLAAILEKLAALTGDDDARNRQIAKILSDSNIESLLDQLVQDLGDAPYRDQIKQLIPDAKNAVILLKNGSYENGQAKSSAATVQKLLITLNRIVALTRGINLTSAQDIANIAQTIAQDNQQKNNWVFSQFSPEGGLKNIKSSDPPIRNGINVVNSKQGCDPAGFVTYVLTRKKEDSANKGIFCKDCIAPEFNALTKYFSPILTVFADTGGENLKMANLQIGDIALIKRASSDQPSGEKDAFIITNITDITDGGSKIHATYCANPGGPKIVDDLKSTLTDQQLLRILRYRYDNST